MDSFFADVQWNGENEGQRKRKVEREKEAVDSMERMRTRREHQPSKWTNREKRKERWVSECVCDREQQHTIFWGRISCDRIIRLDHQLHQFHQQKVQWWWWSTWWSWSWK